MVRRLYSAALSGIDGVPVTVEVDIAPGLPGAVIVGLPDQAIRESRERVRMAIRNSGFEYPLSKVTVNLAPADLRKEGACYDLPVAVGILLASGTVNLPDAGSWLMVGELSLDGSILPVRGLLPLLCCAAEVGITRALIPRGNLPEASLAAGIDIRGTSHLLEALDILKGESEGERPPPEPDDAPPSAEFDLAGIRGQALAKRALSIAAAGVHHLLMVGPPGTGKTMLAKTLSGILPPLSRGERLEVTRVYSAAGLLTGQRPVVALPPIRSPHHTVSRAGLVGGGPCPRPGEISLAHRGVLFLDELPEFPRSVTEVLRQPIEDGRIVLSRAAGSLTYPCRFQVVAAMNPCPCGWFGSRKHSCRCSPGMVRSYRDRLSGPLLDRIDLRVELPEVSYAELAGPEDGEGSATVRQRVIQARSLQAARNPGGVTNASLTLAELRTVAAMPPPAARLLEAAVTKLGLSPRAYVRIQRVARSCADLDGVEKVAESHVAEALQFRTGPIRGELA